MDGSLARLCELFDISRDLHGNLVRGLMIIGVPSVLNIVGAFFFGFRMIASTVITNTSLVFALANALRPWACRLRIEERRKRDDNVSKP